MFLEKILQAPSLLPFLKFAALLHIFFYMQQVR